MNSVVKLIAATTLLVLAGSAVQAAPPSLDELAAKKAKKGTAPVRAPTVRGVLSKPGELDGQTVYQVLLGEIAAQRGAPELAAAALADAARRTGDAGLYLRAIQVASAARQYDLSLDLARRWADGAPEDRHARQALAGILAALGQSDELMVHLRALLADELARERTLLGLPRYFSHSADRADVLRRVRELAEPYAGVAEAQFAVGVAAQGAGENELALRNARRAQELRPDWAPPVLLEVQVLGRERAGAGLAALERALQRNPGATELRMHRARLLAAERRWAEAREEFDRVLAVSPDATEVIYSVALVAVQQRDFAAAERLFRQLLETDFADKDVVHFQLGNLAEERRDYEDAIRHFSNVDAGEYALPAKTHIVQLLARQGKLNEARLFLSTIVTDSPQERQRLILAEANLYRQSGDYKAAFEVIAKALQGEPDDPDLLYDQAMIAERLARVDVLEANLNKVISLRPENAHAYNALGYSLADRNVRLDEARRLIGKALELAPDDPFIMDSMGWVLYRLGSPAEALRYLERAYVLRPDPEIAAHMGEVLWSVGRRDEARKLWREARQNHPDNEVLTATEQKFAP